MSRLTWDAVGEKYYETGVDRGVVYPQVSGAYPKGEAWNGLISSTVTPSGAEPTKLYANNHVYGTMMSTEEVGGTIECYTFPKAFGVCNGLVEAAKGVNFGQQKRVPFGFTFRNLIGNDTDSTAHGYKLHIIYGALASPSEDANTTINDSPEAKTMSFEYTTTPVEVADFDPVAHIEIDSREADPTKLKALEDILYGSESEEARMPLPAEIITLMGEATGA